MTTYRSKDGVDDFVVLSAEKEPVEDRPLGSVLRLNRRQRDARKLMAKQIADEMAMTSDAIGAAVMAITGTNIWREWARSELPQHAPTERALSYLQTKDPIVRALLKARHQLIGTINAVRALIDKEPPR